MRESDNREYETMKIIVIVDEALVIYYHWDLRCAFLIIGILVVRFLVILVALVAQFCRNDINCDRKMSFNR